LQVRIAFLDDLVEQLNDQVVQQSLEIADLKKQMQLIYQRIESLICQKVLQHLTQ
jgi:SlyX protein